MLIICWRQSTPHVPEFHHHSAYNGMLWLHSAQICNKSGRFGHTSAAVRICPHKASQRLIAYSFALEKKKEFALSGVSVMLSYCGCRGGGLRPLNSDTIGPFPQSTYCRVPYRLMSVFTRRHHNPSQRQARSARSRNSNTETMNCHQVRSIKREGQCAGTLCRQGM